MTEDHGQAGNGTIEAAATPTLKRVEIYERVTELVDSGLTRQEAFAQVANERESTIPNVSGAYYSERKRRLATITEGVDPHAAIIEALSAVEEALAEAKVVIASATMQYERLREDAAKYAELRKLIR